MLNDKQNVGGHLGCMKYSKLMPEMSLVTRKYAENTPHIVIIVSTTNSLGLNLNDKHHFQNGCQWPWWM